VTRFSARAVALRLVVLVVATVIAALGAEAMFRWYVWHTYDAEFPPWTENLVPVPGPQIFQFKPKASGVFPGNVDSSRTFPYRTNWQGLRDRDRAAKQPGTTRVLVIGDSYTWGYAVAEDEAFPQTAERLLKERGYSHIEVINGGVPDYNSRQERQLLERLLPVYRPDAVVLGYLVNDAEPSTAMPVPPDEVYRHADSWFLAELQDVANRRLFRRRVLPSRKETAGGSYLDGFAGDSHKWRDSKQAIREMRDMCAAAGIPFAILMLPDFTHSFDEQYGWRPIHDAVAGWGRELGVPVFDLLIPFLGEDHLSLWVPWDGHPNAEAHRRIAAFLVERILEDLRLRTPAQATPARESFSSRS
jgi:lysophospholipase L1-like esterase